MFVFRGSDADQLTVDDAVFTDRITDFAAGDKIDLGFAVSDVGDAPGLLFTTADAAFDYASTATLASGEVLALTVGADTYLFYDADGSGGANSATSVIALNGVTAVTTASFVSEDFYQVAG
jgi:serralysin